ncbi:hypothetical protein Tco_0425134 [Tanacetum coccineum]
MVISSPYLTDIKNCLVQKQTAFSKDCSNPFTVDSLLKTIWFSTYHASYAPCYSNEALAILEQTAIGKEISNSFMAGEDCWVLEDSTTYCCWFNIGAASEDLVLLRKIEEIRLIIVSLVDLSRLAATLNRLERSIQIGIYTIGAQHHQKSDFRFKSLQVIEMAANEASQGWCPAFTCCEETNDGFMICRKHCVRSNNLFEFLREIAGMVPDLADSDVAGEDKSDDRNLEGRKGIPKNRFTGSHLTYVLHGGALVLSSASVLVTHLDRAEGGSEPSELFCFKCITLSNRVLALESIKDAQAAEISALKSRIKKLEKKCKPSISHHRAWLKSVNILSMKKKIGNKESVSKQGRKKSKPESTLDDSTVFDDQDADHGMKYMETEEAVDEGRQSGETKEVKLTYDSKVVEDKGSGDEGGNAEELVSIARPEVSTARPDIDAARQEDSAVKPRTPLTTTSIFDDEDITMAQTLIKIKEEKAKEKGVSIKDVDDSSRPARSILTLKPLPIIDPKDKGKGFLKESPVEYRHNQLNKKTFEEIQALYIKEQERDADFVPIGSERDEKMIDKMNKKATGMIEEKVPEEPESTKVEVKHEGRDKNIKKRSGRRLKMKATMKSKRQKNDYDLEEEEQLRASLKIVPDEEKEINYEVLGTRYPIVNWESAFYHTDRYGVPHDYYRVFRANGSSRYIKNFTEMVSRFDRLDFIELHISKVSTYREQTLERMMELRLNAESEDEAVFDLLRFIQKQINEFGGQDRNIKNWLVQKQTDFGKDFSNPFIVDSLLETIWFSTHHTYSKVISTPCFSDEALAIPGAKGYW